MFVRDEAAWSSERTAVKISLGSVSALRSNCVKDRIAAILIIQSHKGERESGMKWAGETGESYIDLFRV